MKDDRLHLHNALMKGLKQRRARLWEDSIKRALHNLGEGNIDTALDKIARAMILQAEMGEQWAIKELGDRLDGKATQQVDIGVADDVPAGLRVTFHGRDETDRVPAETRMPLSS